LPCRIRGFGKNLKRSGRKCGRPSDFHKSGTGIR
jgi:hypothetical protein